MTSSDNFLGASSFVEILRWRALHQPDQHAYTFLTDTPGAPIEITYAELDQRARHIAALLQSQGLCGTPALLLYPPGIDYIVAFYGCLYAGVIAVPAYPPKRNRSIDRIKNIMANAQATTALTTNQLFVSLQRCFSTEPEMERLHWITTDTMDGDHAEHWQNREITQDTLAFFQYTSGTTGRPKGVMLTHRNLLHNVEFMRSRPQQTEDSKILTWLPPYHYMGLISGILLPLYTGFPAILMSPAAFFQRPIRWLEAISHYKATMSGGPNFAYELCLRKVTAEQLKSLDLSCWSMAFTGAEPINMNTLDDFASTFAPAGFHKNAWYPCYGLAEATLFVAGGARESLPVAKHFTRSALERGHAQSTDEDGEHTQVLVSCGKHAKDQRIMIVNPSTHTQCQPGQIDEIWLSGPSVAQGYWNLPSETEKTFQARLSTGEGPFLRTSDVGFLLDDELFAVGRLTDLITIGENLYYPQDIELTVRRSHSILQQGNGATIAVSIANKQQLVVMHEIDRHFPQEQAPALLETIRQNIKNRHGLPVYAVVLIKQGSILKTSSGKIQRFACRAAFLTNALEVVFSSIEDQFSPSLLSLGLAKEMVPAPL